MSYKLQAPSMRQIVAGQNDAGNKQQASSIKLQATSSTVPD